MSHMSEAHVNMMEQFFVGGIMAKSKWIYDKRGLGDITPIIVEATTKEEADELGIIQAGEKLRKRKTKEVLIEIIERLMLLTGAWVQKIGSDDVYLPHRGIELKGYAKAKRDRSEQEPIDVPPPPKPRKRKPKTSSLLAEKEKLKNGKEKANDK